MTDLDLVRAVLAQVTGWQSGSGRSSLGAIASTFAIPLGRDGHSWIAQALGFRSARLLWAWEDAPGRTFADVEARLRAAERRLAGAL